MDGVSGQRWSSSTCVACAARTPWTSCAMPSSRAKGAPRNTRSKLPSALHCRWFIFPFLINQLNMFPPALRGYLLLNAHPFIPSFGTFWSARGAGQSSGGWLNWCPKAKMIYCFHFIVWFRWPRTTSCPRSCAASARTSWICSATSETKLTRLKPICSPKLKLKLRYVLVFNWNVRANFKH